MALLDSYKKERDEILAQYDKLLNSEMLPIQYGNYKYTAEDLTAKKNDLLNGKFYVAIVGEMKAGKSFLLNTIIFKDDIMPSGNTPLTSAITYIKYTDDKPYFEAVFYDNTEWKTVENSMRENTEFAEKFETSLSYIMSEHNINYRSLLGKSVKFSEYDKLVEYVAPAEQGQQGKYTPVVKAITFYHNLKEFKDIIFVDTPGTNDPNEIRTRITIDFVKQADAVLYAMYASQTLTSQDIIFIDTYLPHIKDENKFLVINKVDTLGGSISSLDTWIEDEVLNNKLIVANKTFTSATTRVYVSALAERIYQKEIAKIPLDENDQYYKDQFKENNFDTDNNHKQFGKLMEELDKKLIQNRAQNLLDTHKESLKGIIANGIKIKKVELEKTNQQIEDIKLPIADLEEKKKKLEDIIESTRCNKKETLEALKACDTDAKNDFVSLIEAFMRALKTDMNNLVNHVNKETLRNLQYGFDQAYGMKKESLAGDIRKKMAAMSDKYRMLIRELRDKLPKDFKLSLATLDTSFSLISDDYFKNIDDEMHNTLGNSVVAQIVDENSGLLSRLVGKLPWNDTYIEKIQKEIQKHLDRYFTSGLEQKLKSNIKAFVERGAREIHPALANIVEESLLARVDKINEYTQNITDQAQSIKSLEKEIKQMQDDITSYEKLLKSLGAH